MKTKSMIAFALAALGVLLLLLRWRRPLLKLAGQTVLITGGSRGLGFILARELARAGCQVVICGRDPDELEEARVALAQEGAAILAVPCDVADQAQVDELIAAAMARFGQIDILINNVGVIQAGPLQAMTVADFQAAHAVMFWGVLYPTLAVLPQMRARRSGRIVNITSIGGKVSVPHLLPYSSAKFATVGLTEGLRAELRTQGILVTNVAPGLMRTGSYLNAFFKGKEANEFAWFALGASLPVISMDAERAARQTIRALQRGEAERVLSIPANLLAKLHGLFPGFTADLLGLVAMLLLPKPPRSYPRASQGDDAPAMHGALAQEELPTPRRQVVAMLTTLGRRAARRFQ